MAIVLFAGTGRLARHLTRLGFQVLAFERFMARRHIESAIEQVDFHSTSCRAFLLSLLRSPQVTFLYMSPPTSTTSRVANRVANGRRAQLLPRPLRSDRCPQGMPNLPQDQQTRLSLANDLLQFAFIMFETAAANAIPVVCENPFRSFLWRQPGWHSKSFHSVSTDLCEHGETYKKRVRLMFSNLDLTSMALNCSGQHAHESWFVRRDSDGAAKTPLQTAVYPKLFCQRIAAIAASAAVLLGLPPRAQRPQTPPEQPSYCPAPALSAQPRRSAMLMSEFHSTEVVSSPVPRVVASMLPAGTHGFPRDAKVLDSQIVGEVVAGFSHSVRLGFYRTPHEWVNEAMVLPHPLNSTVGLRSDVYDMVDSVVKWSDQDLENWRGAMLAKYVARATALEAQEAALHLQMSTPLRGVLSGKRLLLLQEMMVDADCVDVGLAMEMAKGFDLVGSLTVSGEYGRDAKVASLEVDTLKQLAPFLQARAFQLTRPSEDLSADRDVWDATMKEVEKGWLSETSVAELNKEFCGAWIPSRRFGVRQKSKTRVIDDFSASQVNSCVTVGEKLKLEGVDDLLCALRLWYRSVVEVGTRADRMQLMGRCFDLKSAYRQLGVAESSSFCSVVSVWCPIVQRQVLFKLHALPFGAISAVYCFNRVALAIRNILVRLFKVMACNYYDDYPVVSSRSMCRNTDHVVSGVFDLLGFTLTTDPDKVADFSETFDLLGVVMDLTGFKVGEVVVRNKPSRQQEVLSLIADVQKEGCLSKQVAASLRGRLAFLEAQHCNRLGCIAGRVLGMIASGRKDKVLVEDEVATALDFYASLIGSIGPRSIALMERDPPVFVYTD
eukprot:6490303-Amphidinium_carterae.1